MFEVVCGSGICTVSVPTTYACEEAREGSWVSSCHSLLIPSDQGLLLNLELGWTPGSPKCPSVSARHSADVTGMCSHIQLFSRMLGDLNSGPLGYLSNPVLYILMHSSKRMLLDCPPSSLYSFNNQPLCVGCLQHTRHL